MRKKGEIEEREWGNKGERAERDGRRSGVMRERERERERESVCVCVCERKRESERERE